MNATPLRKRCSGRSTIITWAWAVFVLSVVALPGCEVAMPQPAPPEPPTIPVSQPVEREVTDIVDFTGRTDAVESVDIRARVTGYLVKMPFKEGAEVKAGDCCSRSIRGPTRPSSTRLQGRSSSTRRQLAAGHGATLARDRAVAATPGAVSQQQLDQDQAAVDEAEAAGQGVQASMEVYKLNLELHQGDLADRRPGQPLLPHARQPGQPGPDAADHRRVARPDVRLLRHGRAHRCCASAGRSTRARSSDAETGEIPVLMGLQGEDGYPAPGHAQLRQQPGQSHHRQHLGARRLRQSQAGRAASGCCRPACSCASGCRSASRIRRCWSSTGPSAPTRD